MTAGQPALARMLERPAAQLGLLLVVGLVTRASVFGDLSYFSDELFYFLAGQRMHYGLLPYVDVWDRKGPALFLTYYLIAGVSKSVWAYQIAAWLFASSTAFVIARIALRFTGVQGALAAGSVYLFSLALFGGAGGQSPVFYNLWMALAALLVLRGKWREMLAAMALAGLAIAYKQSAAPEALFLGLAALWRLRQDGTKGGALVCRALVLAVAGALPFALFALFYLAVSHFDAFWQAMVTSNLRKAYNPVGDHWTRIAALAKLSSPLWLGAIAGMALGRKQMPRWFIGGWIFAALIGFVSVPNFYEHYLLPVLVPLSVASASLFNRGAVGLGAAAAAALVFAANSPMFAFAKRAEARAAMEQIAADIRTRQPNPRLFVYEGPVWLYAMLDSYPPSPLLNNFHLYFPPEEGVSQFDSAAEVQRNLNWKPDVIVTYNNWEPWEENARTAPLVRGYVAQKCRHWATRDYHENYRSYRLDVWGDCNAAPIPSAASPAPGPRPGGN
ncbi:hypothetical protein OKA06_15265 [Novosphingobium sp. MW5]|nr:hypothetical protein [Novosphingobium sp. MW5]